MDWTDKLTKKVANEVRLGKSWKQATSNALRSELARVEAMREAGNSLYNELRELVGLWHDKNHIGSGDICERCVPEEAILAAWRKATGNA